MSPKGTQPENPPVTVGAQLALNPWLASLLSVSSPSCRQGIPAPPGAASSAPAIEGFKPPGRKKFISAELTQGPSRPLPQGTAPLPTVKGLAGVCPAASAALKLATIRSPRTVLALMGRFR